MCEELVTAERADTDYFSADFIRTQEELWREFSSAKSKPVASSQGSMDDHPTSSTNQSFLEMQPPTACIPDVAGFPDSVTIKKRTDEDLSTIFQDKTLIEEQRRILEQIEEQTRFSMVMGPPKSPPGNALGKSLSSTTCTTATTSESSKYSRGRFDLDAGDSPFEGYGSPNSVTCSPIESSRGPHNMSANRDLNSKKNPIRHQQDDQVIRMGKDRLNVKGTRHAYESISNGSAAIVQCSSCQAILQVGSTAKLIYCVNCQQVTPIEMARNVSAGRIGATDRHIAKAVQMQEVDVACARKTSELDNENGRRVAVVARRRFQ